MSGEAKWNFIIVGEQGVGKTSIMTRYVKENFSEAYRATVVVDYLFKRVKVRGRSVLLHIWDSAGTEQFNSVCPQYFRKAEGCILVYDLTRATTFHQLSGWLARFRDYNQQAPVLIVGNKSEETDAKSVSKSVVKSYAEQEEMDFMECSAKTGHNVQQVFQYLLEKVWEIQNPPVSASMTTAQAVDNRQRPEDNQPVANGSPEVSEPPHISHMDETPSFVLEEEQPQKKKKKKCC